MRIGAIRPATAGEAATAAAEIAASEGASATREVHEIHATSAPQTAAITDALVTGAIDAETAKSQLIDAVVASALPPGASASLLAELRAEVAAMLLHNPQLDQLLRRA